MTQNRQTDHCLLMTSDYLTTSWTTENSCSNKLFTKIFNILPSCLSCLWWPLKITWLQQALWWLQLAIFIAKNHHHYIHSAFIHLSSTWKHQPVFVGGRKTSSWWIITHFFDWCWHARDLLNHSIAFMVCLSIWRCKLTIFLRKTMPNPPPTSSRL